MLPAALLVLSLGAPAAVPPPPVVSPAAAGPVTVVAAASKSEVGLGEVFTVELRASGPPGTSFSFPAEAEDERFELHSEAPARSAGPVAPLVHRYRAALFALGEAEIPPIPVRYRLPQGSTGEARSGPLKLRVLSVLPKDPQQQKLADIRGPMAVAIGPAFWVALAVLALLAAAAAYWVVQRRKAAAAPALPAAPELAADEEARRALDALGGSELVARREYRVFYIRLTEIAKRYLERRLGAPVLEMTSAETLAFLRRHPLGDALVLTVRDLAEAADRIKFARGEGLAAEAERHLAAVRALVVELEQRLTPPAPPAEGRAA